MELKIDFTKSEFARRLDRQLGISEQRIKELFDAMEEINDALIQDSKLKITGGSIGTAYKGICALCNNIEEYTLCMHVFIFRAARIGYLKSEVESN